MTFAFHRLVFWPDVCRAALPSGVHRLFWTDHALRETVQDKYGVIPQVHQLDLNACDIFECRIQFGGGLESLALRTQCPGRPDFDICLVLVPHKEDILRVKTVWLNHVGDVHRTLDESRYCKRWFA